MTEDMCSQESAPQAKRLTTNCKACQEGPESLSRRLVAALNACDYDNPVLDHVAPNALTRHECFEASSRQELIDRYPQISEAYPSYGVRVTDSTGEVDDFKARRRSGCRWKCLGVPRTRAVHVLRCCIGASVLESGVIIATVG